MRAVANDNWSDVIPSLVGHREWPFRNTREAPPPARGKCSYGNQLTEMTSVPPPPPSPPSPPPPSMPPSLSRASSEE